MVHSITRIIKERCSSTWISYFGTECSIIKLKMCSFISRWYFPSNKLEQLYTIKKFHKCLATYRCFTYRASLYTRTFFQRCCQQTLGLEDEGGKQITLVSWRSIWSSVKWRWQINNLPDLILSRSGSVAERSKVSNSGSNGCEFEPRARTSVLRWPLNANFHRLSRSRCYFVELRCRWFRTKAASAYPLLETIDRV